MDYPEAWSLTEKERQAVEERPGLLATPGSLSPSLPSATPQEGMNWKSGGSLA